MTSLRYDVGNMRPRTASAVLARAKREVIRQAEDGEQGWLFLPDDREMRQRVRALVKHAQSFTDLLVIGIGGSDLGTRALHAALRTEKTRGCRLHVAGSNTDPDELSEILAQLDLSKTLINIISKSGDTVEPMTTFLIVRDALIRAVGADRAADHIVATTDAQHGSLRALAEQEGYRTLPVAGNVGGRFSVLTDVGLFPLAAAGINIEKLLDGARKERDAFLTEPLTKNDACLFAAAQYEQAMQGKTIQVLMPYAARLREFAQWYRQLWAESLGKNNGGPTPVAALGATDQHSQIQLYMEGPNDKTITCIDVERFETTLRVPASARRIDALAYLANTPLSTILRAEREATVSALTAAKRANGTIFLPRITPETMGALVMFFEIATGISGELYGINAYNQPGVEAGKLAMKQLLS